MYRGSPVLNVDPPGVAPVVLLAHEERHHVLRRSTPASPGPRGTCPFRLNGFLHVCAVVRAAGVEVAHVRAGHVVGEDALRRSRSRTRPTASRRRWSPGPGRRCSTCSSVPGVPGPPPGVRLGPRVRQRGARRERYQREGEWRPPSHPSSHATSSSPPRWGPDRRAGGPARVRPSETAVEPSVNGPDRPKTSERTSPKCLGVARDRGGPRPGRPGKEEGAGGAALSRRPALGFGAPDPYEGPVPDACFKYRR